MLLDKELAAGLHVKVDVSLTGELTAEIKCDVIAQLEALAAKTDNKLDDKLVALVKAALGR